MAFRRASARVPQRQLGKGAGGMLLFPLLAETSPKSKPQPALLESSFPSPPAAGTAGATRPSPGSVRGPEPPRPPTRSPLLLLLLFGPAWGIGAGGASTCGAEHRPRGRGRWAGPAACAQARWAGPAAQAWRTVTGVAVAAAGKRRRRSAGMAARPGGFTYGSTDSGCSALTSVERAAALSSSALGRSGVTEPRWGTGRGSAAKPGGGGRGCGIK